MRFNKSALFNFLIIFLIVVGLVGLYEQLIELTPQGIIDRIVSLTAKNGLWIGLGFKLLDWLTKQKENFDRSIKLAIDTAESNRETIKELTRVLSELDARNQKQTQDLYVFKAETSVNTTLAELRQEVREIQHRLIDLELERSKGQ